MRIAPLPAAEATRLGEAFSAIDPWRAYGYPAAALVELLAASEPGAPRLALYDGSEIIGAAVIRTHWLRGPYLQFLALLPQMQRRGVGSSFLGWMERQARAGGESNLWVAGRGSIRVPFAFTNDTASAASPSSTISSARV